MTAMNRIEIHPLSVTVGAVVAALLLFACSSRSSGSPIMPTPVPTPAVSTQVTFYGDTVANNPNSAFPFTWTLGTTSAATVITDVSWLDTSSRARLLVNGVVVYGWGFGGSRFGTSYGYATPSRFSLANGIRVPANATLAIEGVENSSTQAWSLAGYTL